MTYDSSSPYGFDSTDSVQYDRTGFPIGLYRMVVKEEEGVNSGVKTLCEILSGELKGQEFTVWFNTKSDLPVTAKIAQQSLKRIADVTGKPIDAKNPLAGRIFCVDVVQSKDPRFTTVKSYHENRYIPAEVAPAGYAKPKESTKPIEKLDDEIPF